MLELPLVKGAPFHHVLEAILDLSDVAHVVCTRRGLNLQAVDTKRAAIVALLFPAEDFPGYACDEYISMGIPIDELVKAIRCCDDTDTIILKVDEYNFETITLSFVSPEINSAYKKANVQYKTGDTSFSENKKSRLLQTKIQKHPSRIHHFCMFETAEYITSIGAFGKLFSIAILFLLIHKAQAKQAKMKSTILIDVGPLP